MAREGIGQELPIILLQGRTKRVDLTRDVQVASLRSFRLVLFAVGIGLAGSRVSWAAEPVNLAANGDFSEVQNGRLRSSAERMTFSAGTWVTGGWSVRGAGVRGRR